MEEYILSLEDLIGEKHWNYIPFLSVIDSVMLHKPIIEVFEYMIEPDRYQDACDHEAEEMLREQASEIKRGYLYAKENSDKGVVCESLDLFMPLGCIRFYVKDESEFIDINDPEKESLADHPAIIKEKHHEEFGKYKWIELCVEIINNAY